MLYRTSFLALIALLGLLAAAGCGERSIGLEDHTGDLEATRVVFDLVERAGSAETVRHAPLIAVGEETSEKNRVMGWSHPETNPESKTAFAWAVAQRAVLETTLLDTDLATLDLRCRPFVWEGAPDQLLRVLVNGREIGDVPLAPGSHEYSLPLPAGVVGVGLNRVELGFSWAEAPADHVPGATDRRTLAAAFEWVRFGPPDARRPAGVDEPTTRGSSLVIPPGTGLRYRLTLPADAVLDFGIEPTPNGSGPGGLVWVSKPGAPAVQAVRLDPGDSAGDRVRFNVGPAAGEILELGFAATGGGAEEAAMVIHSPRVLGGDEGAAEVASLLLIEIDTLRADYLGAYGADVKSPNIDSIASRGVLFSQARSHIPITGPSHASIFTSMLPMEHGVHNNAQELTGGFMTMAESLQAAGRHTAAVISLGVMQRQFGFDRGFDHYGDHFPRDWMKNAAEVTDEALAWVDESLTGPYFLWTHYSDPHEPYAPPNLVYPRIELRLDGQRIGEIDSGGRGNVFDVIVPPGDSELEFVPLDPEPGRIYRFDTLRFDNEAIGFEPLDGWHLREKRVGLPTYQTELPAAMLLTNSTGQDVSAEILLTCKQRLSKPEIRQRYAQEVEYADREIGRLLAGLEERGLLENTLVIFASDHGEGLGNHNHIGHVSQLYDSLLHVPLVFMWPGRLPQGLVIDEPVSLIDVFPTVADLLGIARPVHGTGLSLRPLFDGDEHPRQPFLAATYPPESARSIRAIIQDGFKFIHSWTDDRDWVELYNVDDDPGELDDLAETHPDRLERLRAELQQRLADLSESAPVQAELSEEEKAHLRALGYIHD